MKEPVDNNLVNRIKQVFDEYQDPTADAGWEALREKFPATRRRRPAYLWAGTAAAILLMLLGLWYFQTNEYIGETKKIKAARTEAPKENQSTSSNLEKETYDSDINQKAPIIAGDKAADGKKQLQFQPPFRSLASSTRKDKANPSSESVTLETELIDQQSLFSVEQINKARLAGITSGSSEIPYIEIYISPVTSKIENELNNDVIAHSVDDKTQVKKPAEQRLSIFAAGFLNYSEGSENKLNFGAGFLKDLRLSKNLKLSSGLGISANSLNYDKKQALPGNAARSFDVMRAVSANTQTTITSYEAELITLDVPINLKYQFVPESDEVYFMAGVSSGTYLAEKYAYRLQSVNQATGNFSSSITDQEINKEFSKFDLARTLNISLGISRDFGKKQKISIEPFLKYPLGGLGSENIKFGSTGINLRLHFYK